MCGIFDKLCTLCSSHLSSQLILVPLEYALAGWTYYVYMLRLRYCYTQVDELMLDVVFIVLLAMCMWSYTMAVFYPLRPVPEDFRMSESEWAEIEFDVKKQKEVRDRLGIQTTNSVRGVAYAINYCKTCGVIKPDRCHHCRRCGVCVLRMDHHCPWLGTCVGFHNHKFFLLLLHYAFVYSIFLVITCTGALPRIYELDFVAAPHDASTSRHTGAGGLNSTVLDNSTMLSHKDVQGDAGNLINHNHVTHAPSVNVTAGEGGGEHWVMFYNTGLSAVFIQVSVVVVLHSLVIASMLPLLHLHAYLMARNVTTLEYTRPLGLPGVNPTTRLFDLGSVSANHKEIMGPSVCLWLVPVFTGLGTGTHFNIWREDDHGEKTRVWSAIDLL